MTTNQNKFINYFPIGYCTKCGTEDSLLLLLGNDHAIRASDYNPEDNFSYHLLHCSNCDGDYLIDWRDGYPRPLRDPIKVRNIIDAYRKYQ